MWEKIKAFFQKKSVITVEVVVMVLCIIGLILGGLDAKDVVVKLADYVGAALLAIGALIKAIKAIIG